MKNKITILALCAGLLAGITAQAQEIEVVENSQEVIFSDNISPNSLGICFVVKKGESIEDNSKVYALRLPNNMATTFIEKQDSIYAYEANKYLNKRKTVKVNEGTGSSKNAKGAQYHKIKSGETLGGIALRYGVSVKQLRNLNGINGNNIRAGKSIRIR